MKSESIKEVSPTFPYTSMMSLDYTDNEMDRSTTICEDDKDHLTL